MPNWCHNHMTITGPADEIARFRSTCIRPQGDSDELGFDFTAIVPIPPSINDTRGSSLIDDALLVLGRPECGWIKSNRTLEERMAQVGVADVEAFRAWIEQHHRDNAAIWSDEADPFAGAERAIAAYEATGHGNSSDWATANWGTKYACDFEVITDEPGCFEFRFDTPWSLPEPIYEKLGPMFPDLTFEFSAVEFGMGWAYEGTVRGDKAEMRDVSDQLTGRITDAEGTTWEGPWDAVRSDDYSRLTKVQEGS
jgi:hypothetical protein